MARIKADFVAELAAIEAESIGWIPLGNDPLPLSNPAQLRPTPGAQAIVGPCLMA